MGEQQTTSAQRHETLPSRSHLARKQCPFLTVSSIVCSILIVKTSTSGLTFPCCVIMCEKASYRESTLK